MKEKMHIMVLSLGICTLMGLTFANFSSRDYQGKEPQLNSAPETTVSSKKNICNAAVVSDSSQETKEHNKNLDKWLVLYNKIKTLGGDTTTYGDPCDGLKGKKRTECNINNIELHSVLNQIKKLEERLAPYEACKNQIKDQSVNTKKMSSEVNVLGFNKNNNIDKKERSYPSIKDGFPWGKDVRLSSVPGPLIAYTIEAKNDNSVSSIEIIFDIKIPEKYVGLLEFEKIELQREDNKTEMTGSSICSMQKISSGYHVSCKGLNTDIVSQGTSAWYSVYVFPSKVIGTGNVVINFIDFKYKEGKKYKNHTTNLTLNFIDDPRPIITTSEEIVHIHNNGNIDNLGTFTIMAPNNNIPVSVTVIPLQVGSMSGGLGTFNDLSITDGTKNYQCGFYLGQKKQPICENLSFDTIQSGDSKKFTLKGKIENAKSGEEYIIYVAGLGFNKDIPNNPIINDGRLQIIVD